jgi:hypothetical protein
LPAVEEQFHVIWLTTAPHMDLPAIVLVALHFEYQVKEAIAYLETVVKEPAHHYWL